MVVDSLGKKGEATLQGRDEKNSRHPGEEGVGRGIRSKVLKEGRDLLCNGRGILTSVPR